jgi:hypothetical protein
LTEEHPHPFLRPLSGFSGNDVAEANALLAGQPIQCL